MLFSWMPVPGTITPEPEPVDDESDAAFPSASTAETCVVPPAGVVLLRPRAVGDARGRLGQRVVGEQPLGEPAAVERLGERVVADARLLAHHLDERPDRLADPGRRAGRSRSASPYAIRMPPDDGGGFEITS